ncbi:MAG: division/cell wall cluster transcriptional repressor MraZ [Actinobacteria bacterium]|nr:division/cell wall cluster transcriptional repressor MraZ [Actinomycetota bacterium]
MDRGGLDDPGTEFLGEFRHALDTKGRMILPADFREELGGEAYVTAFPDGCLAIYRPREWKDRVASVRQRVAESDGDRAEARLLGALSVKVAPDNQGRVAIPPKLRQFARLEKEVVVVGVFNHVELWNPEKWSEQEAAGQAGLLSGQGSLARAGF